MLEPRKLKVVCFKARLKKNKKNLTFSIGVQLLTGISGYDNEFHTGSGLVRMYSCPELRGDLMFLRGDEPGKRSTVRGTYTNVDTAFEQQKLNLKEAGRLIKIHMEQGYYGERKRCRQA